MSETKHTPGPWGIMNDGPSGDGKPWRAMMEAAPGLTIGSPHNTEPICRLSGYLQPVEANAALIIAAPETAAERDRLRESNAELLAALREIQEMAGRWAMPDGPMLESFCGAAIARAEG